MSVHRKADRRERRRLYAQGYPRRTPVAMRVSAEVRLGPTAWARFCELAGIDDETGDALPSDGGGL